MFLDSRQEDKSSGPNGSKHYPSSVSSEFPPQSGIDLLQSSPNIWTVEVGGNTIHNQHFMSVFPCENIGDGFPEDDRETETCFL
jgi:hypothetical protein